MRINCKNNKLGIGECVNFLLILQHILRETSIIHLEVVKLIMPIAIMLAVTMFAKPTWVMVVTLPNGTSL